MKFFGNNESKSNKDSADNVAISSIVGKGMIVTGDLSFAGKLRIDGQIIGNIQGEHLILGESGNISGDIETDTCTCQGHVNGNIKSRDLNVIKGCKIEGNVSTIYLHVESGSSLNGKVHVDDKDLRLVKGSAPQKVESVESAAGAK